MKLNFPCESLSHSTRYMNKKSGRREKDGSFCPLFATKTMWGGKCPRRRRCWYYFMLSRGFAWGLFRARRPARWEAAKSVAIRLLLLATRCAISMSRSASKMGQNSRRIPFGCPEKLLPSSPNSFADAEIITKTCKLFWTSFWKTS